MTELSDTAKELDRSPATINKAYKRACEVSEEKTLVQLRKEVKELQDRMNRASRTVGELLNRVDALEQRSEE